MFNVPFSLYIAYELLATIVPPVIVTIPLFLLWSVALTSVADSKLESVGDYVYFIAAPNANDIEAKILEMIK